MSPAQWWDRLQWGHLHVLRRLGCRLFGHAWMVDLSTPEHPVFCTRCMAENP